jgi:signal transduction histidine kinase/ActR/RegA family two-component response regulator
MADAPSSGSRALISQLIAFGRDLARTASAEDALDQLLACAATTLAARECAAAWSPAVGIASIIRTRPANPKSREPLLSLARQMGPTLLNSGSHDLARRVGVTLSPEDAAADWILVPLITGGESSGSLVACRDATPFNAADLAIAEALAASVSLTLQRIASTGIELPRPSWQEGLDAITPALCLIDQTECIRRANRAFAWLVTTPPDALLGRPWQSLVPPDWVPHLERAIRAEGFNREVELRLGDRVYSASVAPLPGPSGADVVLVFDDQSERHRLQDQLVQSEKMSAIGQLIAGVAHDLNNPLASVVGFAEFLSERPDVPAALREPVTVIREEAERASGIVKNLLTFARKQERRRRPTIIQPLLESTVALLRNELMSSRVECRIEVDPDLSTPVLDANQMQQVFVNLIHNAAQAIAASGRPGTITVRARRWTDGIAVDVIDDGPGMSEALATQVFEPFFTTKPEGHGTGLGLSISQGIVTEHGGRITLETAEGWGSTFTVHLPAGEGPAPVVSEGTPSPAPGLRILVVDDEPHILHYMRATLESWGHSVSQAADGEEARERLRADGFDLVIADLRMPRLGGREFYEELKRTWPAQAEQVVFSTGDTVRGDTLAFLKSVGRPYLHKPFSLTELRALLAGVSKTPDE